MNLLGSDARADEVNLGLRADGLIVGERFARTRAWALTDRAAGGQHGTRCGRRAFLRPCSAPGQPRLDKREPGAQRKQHHRHAVDAS